MPRAHALTSLRAIAAALVVAYHLSRADLLPSGWLHVFEPSAAVGVFFVLSGFVLQSAYGGDLRGQSVAAFLGARLARIWPLYAVTIAVILVIFPTEFAGPDALRTLTLTQAWSWDLHTYFWNPDAAMWSLSCEAAFYALFPLITATVRRHPLAAVLAASAWVLAYIAIVGDLAGNVEHLMGAYYVSPIARLPEFVLGMAAADAAPALRRLRMPAWAWTSAEAVSLAGLVGLNAALTVGRPWTEAHLGAGAAAWLSGAGCAPMAVSVIMLLAVGRGAVSRGLSWRPLVACGEASFAAYLTHQPAIVIASGPLGLAGYVVAAAGLAFLGHVGVERPCATAFGRVAASRRRATDSADRYRRRPMNSATLSSGSPIRSPMAQ